MTEPIFNLAGAKENTQRGIRFFALKQQLRRMLEQGQISKTEYDSAVVGIAEQYGVCIPNL